MICMKKFLILFFRVDSARSASKPGSGLGLSVARDIIRAAGGHIELINQQPRGLLFSVFLPMKELDSQGE